MRKLLRIVASAGVLFACAGFSCRGRQPQPYCPPPSAYSAVHGRCLVTREFDNTFPTVAPVLCRADRCVSPCTVCATPTPTPAPEPAPTPAAFAEANNERLNPYVAK